VSADTALSELIQEQKQGKSRVKELRAHLREDSTESEKREDGHAGTMSEVRPSLCDAAAAHVVLQWASTSNHAETAVPAPRNAKGSTRSDDAACVRGERAFEKRTSTAHERDDTQSLREVAALSTVATNSQAAPSSAGALTVIDVPSAVSPKRVGPRIRSHIQSARRYG
jgi:hypothetical protein